MSRRMSAAVAPRKMAEVFTTAVSRQFLLIGSFSLNYLLDPKSETPPPIGQVRLTGRSQAPALDVFLGYDLMPPGLIFEIGSIWYAQLCRHYFSPSTSFL